MSVNQYGSTIQQVAITTNSGSTNTLVNTSAMIQVFTGTANQSVLLPLATSFTKPGISYEFYNFSTGSVSVKYQDSTAFQTIAANSTLIVNLYDNTSVNGKWTSLSNSTIPAVTPPTAQTLTYNTTPFTGDVLSGNNVLTGISSFTGLYIGLGITGTGIPSNTYITALNPGGSTLTMSANATSGSNTHATLTLQDLTYTAVVGGTSGNSITVAYTTGAAAGHEVVTVSGNAISVQISSGASTATQVLAAIYGSAPALALVTAVVSGTGSNPQTAPASGSLSGGAFNAQTITPTGSGTYIAPTSPAPVYLKITMVGGGSAGSGGFSGPGVGGNGTATTFGTSLLIANGSGGPTTGFDTNTNGAQGTAVINSPAIALKSIPGSFGQGGAVIGGSALDTNGGSGGYSPFGGAGVNVLGGVAENANPNSGSGGCGGTGSSNASSFGGTGGCSGAYLEAWITAPSTIYSYTVGTGGTAGGNGSNGGSGIIIVEEYYF